MRSSFPPLGRCEETSAGSQSERNATSVAILEEHEEAGANWVSAKVRKMLAVGLPDQALAMLERESGSTQALAEHTLLRGAALARRAQQRCSVLDGLQAAAVLDQAMVDKDLAAEAGTLREEVLALLGLADGEVLDEPARAEAEFRRAMRDLGGEQPRRLAADLVAHSPWYAARFAEQLGFPEWGEAVGAGREAEAWRLRQLIEGIAEELAPHDRHLSAIVEALWPGKDSVSTEPPEVLEGLAALGRGIEAYERQNFNEAEADLRRARDSLSTRAAPLALWPRFYLAIANYYRNAREGLIELSAIAALAEDAGYAGLAGRASWLAGTAQMVANDFESASESFGRARRQLSRAGGEPAAAFVDVLEAEAMTFRGDHERAWDLRSQAFRNVPRFEGTRRQIAMLWEAAEGLNRQGRVDLQAPLLDHAIRLSERWGQPLGIATARLQRARWLAERGAAAEAARDIERAASVLASMEDGALKTEMENLLELDRALVVGNDDPRAGATLLGRALVEQRHHGRSLDLLETLPLRARMLFRAGLPAEARADLDEAAAVLRTARDGEDSVRGRDALAQRTRVVVDMLAELRSTEADPIGLVRDLDGLRNRAISESLRTLYPAAEPPLAVSVSIPKGGATVFVHATPEHFFAWSFREGEAPATAVAEATEVLRLVNEFRSRSSLGEDEAALRAALGDLFDVLIRPLGGLELGDRIAVVTDGPSARVPWHALWDGQANRYLIERAEVALYPNLESLERDLSRPRKSAPPVRSRTIVVQGVGAVPGVSLRLSDTAAEANAILRHLGSEGRRVVGSPNAAREVEVLLEQNRVAGYSSSLHFAGHAFENRSDPGKSYLLVAEAVEWQLASMAKTTFASVDEVVLSACSTLDPLAAHDSALLGLGGALFAAGVEAVIGTAGPVADQEAARFAPLLYVRSESNVTSRTAAARFRQAIQRARRNGGREASPGAWGNWLLVGGLKQ